VIPLPEIPKGPTGKLQRIGLADKLGLVAETVASPKDYTPPRTPTEAALAAVWARVLKVDRVGVHDNFLDLGGDSMLATQLFSRVREQFGLELSLTAFFEMPTVAGQAEHIARALAEAPPPIPRRPNLGEAPLSFAQQRLWFLDQFEPGNAAYHRTLAIRLTGELHLEALAQALAEIVRRHETLRTTFPAVDDQPVQRVNAPGPSPLPVHDLGHLPQAEREARARRWLAAESRRPFDLARGPLFRAGLARLSDHDHVLAVAMHHIIFDGWSDRIFWQEFAVLYSAFCEGRASPLPDLPLQYGDFADWQSQQMPEQALEPHLAYWRRQLAGELPELELPLDHPRPRIQTLHGAHHSFPISPALTEALKAFSRRQGVTLFMTLLAGFNALLYRYTGQDDILVGTPIAGRNRVEIEDLIGLFVNTLVMRTRLGGEPTFREIVGRVRQTALEAYTHQALPFEKLVEALRPDRSLNRTPLFQVMFNLRTPVPRIDLPGLAVADVAFENGQAQFDLSLDITETAEGLACSFEYNTDLFEAETIARLARHFQTLLAGAAADPDCRLSQLPLMTPAEQHQLLIEWNQTEAELPAVCLHQLFEAQAERTPDALAVISGAERLTYRQLNRRANQVARALRKFGVGPDTVVGLYLERSTTLLVGLLGILKAGGAYVPLDPAYPKDRIAFMLQDSHLPVLLTERLLAKDVHVPQLRAIYLDSEWEMVAHERDENLDCNTHPHHLAYVIYTSGSTGTPKGVQVLHQGVVNHALSLANEYGLRAEDRVLHFASISFDVAAEELFPTWAVGASVVLRPADWPETFLEFNRFVEREGVSVLNLPAAYWHEWVDDLARSGWPVPAAVRLVVTGSDVVSAERLRRWQAAVGQKVAWRNAYGLTETTISSLLYAPPTHWPDPPTGTVPIGRPIANTQVYVLDAHLQPVPVGVPGELYIGGAGLARGI
jgi:amino acid adenylation domain-containing protein